MNSSTDDSDAFWQQIYQREEAEYNPNQDTASWDILAPKKNTSGSGATRSDNDDQQRASQSSTPKQLRDLKKRECGALWEKLDRNGQPLFNGQIDFDGKMTNIRILPNLNQNSEKNTPQWRIFWDY